jgi:hypothetical protein
VKYKKLLSESKEHIERYGLIQAPVTLDIFSNGGFWMSQRLDELDHNRTKAAFALPFRYYGYLKYITCMAVSGITLGMVGNLKIYSISLSILLFYCCEAHFLFLFPLIIDRVQNPVIESIRQTYRIGLLKSVITVVPIALYMISGLFSYRAPFVRWHVGCLAILIWYQHEIRDWI